MTGPARLGDFLDAAHRSLTPRVGEPPPAPGDVDEVSRSLLRVVTILGRYTQDIATAFQDVPHRTPAPSSPWGQARAQAREALTNAAGFLLHPAACRPVWPSAPSASLLARRLDQVAAVLAAGRDLLHTHFAPGPRGGVHRSPWAATISSERVNRALLGELGALAQPIAHYGANVALAPVPGAPAHAGRRRALNAACQWLWALSASVDDAARQQPVPVADRDLLAAIPVNVLPGRPGLAATGTIPGLCDGVIATAERLRHLAWQSAITQVELAPEGGDSFRLKSRFAKFANTPEMLRMFHVAADIKTADDLNLPVPAIAQREDRQRVPEIVTVEPSEDLLEYVAQLGDRADQVRTRAVGPGEDNMLKISGDGRRAALDLRLVGLPQATPGKTAVAAARIAAIWRANRDREYRAPGGSPYPVRGSLQIVFCDLGTPGPDWNVYDDLRGQLTARGLPRESVRFIHEAKTDRDKAQLFAACRAGRIAVLVGSTEKMGVGTNVQDRAIALHHLDAPWRPADVAQREGRILRQGNLNTEVQILRYTVTGSFDGYMWQALERKARFIGQVMHGRPGTREISDIGDTALSFSEVKALATGNPLLMDKAEADAELARLQRAERAYYRNQEALEYAIPRHQADIQALTLLAADLDVAISRRQDTQGDAFTMTVGNRHHSKRPRRRPSADTPS